MNGAVEIDNLDRWIVRRMRRVSPIALRVSLGVIFIWFGLLKPLGYSPAADLVLKTTTWLPLLSPSQWLSVIGWWEVAIGVTFLIKRLNRVAILLLAMQMVGTFLPLLLLQQVTFQGGNLLTPTLEGQYIIKNLVIIAAALATGARVREP